MPSGEERLLVSLGGTSVMPGVEPTRICYVQGKHRKTHTLSCPRLLIFQEEVEIYILFFWGAISGNAQGLLLTLYLGIIPGGAPRTIPDARD